VKLEPEVTIFEGGPDISETFVPAVSILTVIGLIPFAAAVARQVYTLCTTLAYYMYCHVVAAKHYKPVSE
jgi:hypothetical protein